MAYIEKSDQNIEPPREASDIVKPQPIIVTVAGKRPNSDKIIRPNIDRIIDVQIAAISFKVMRVSALRPPKISTKKE